MARNSLDPWVSSSDFPVVPAASVMSIASQSAQSMNVLQFSPPATNSSYTLKVRGPFLQCSPANASQSFSFDYYNQASLDYYLYITSSS
jgi:hypothetical protein